MFCPIFWADAQNLPDWSLPWAELILSGKKQQTQSKAMWHSLLLFLNVPYLFYSDWTQQCWKWMKMNTLISDNKHKFPHSLEVALAGICVWVGVCVWECVCQMQQCQMRRWRMGLEASPTDTWKDVLISYSYSHTPSHIKAVVSVSQGLYEEGKEQTDACRDHGTLHVVHWFTQSAVLLSLSLSV